MDTILNIGLSIICLAVLMLVFIGMGLRRHGPSDWVLKREIKKRKDHGKRDNM